VKLLDSLLDAIVRLEGDALVMHVGEKPYVITASSSMNAYRGPLAWGQVELSSRVLTFDAVSSMLAQILPPDQQRALDEYGAIEHEILPPNGVLDRFTVVAARGGEDVWVEVRRKPVPQPAASDVAPVAADEPAPVASEPPAAVPAPTAVSPEPAATSETVAIAEPAPVPDVPAAEPEAPVALVTEPVAHPDVPAPSPSEPVHEQPSHVEAAPPTVEPLQESPETVVVAMPGESREEVTLGAAQDNAIQLVHEEPQDVPTEEEVDAMLAATASAILTSGLNVDDVTTISEEESAADQDGQVPQLVVDDESDDEAEVEIVLPVFQDASFELSPPPAVQPEAPPLESEDVDAPSGDVAPGAPLFAAVVEEPVAAIPEPPAPIAAPVAEVAAPELEVVADDELQVDSIEITTDVAIEGPAVVAAADPQPTAEPRIEAAPEFEQSFAAADEIPSATFVPNILIADQQPSSPSPAAYAADPTPAEMRMEATPETRQPEAIANADHRPQAQMSEAAESSARHDDGEGDGRTGVVVPLARTPIKTETIVVPYTPAEDAALMQTLRAAAARGAGTVYVVAQSKPMIRVDGDITPLESEPMLTAADVERLVLELAPPRRRDALQHGPVEWLCDVPEIGRVRCLTFKDHRGPGVLFRMFPPRAISADQLALTPEVQALCQQSDGLVLVTGARASGKSTLLNAFVDLINRTRSDHVITVETQIGFVHESRRSFISQRETRGDAEFAASVARAALREDPDVMMIEDLKSADLVMAAIEAAESGRLVLASVPAASTIGALERMIDVIPADRRAKMRASIATSLRGVVSQVLLRKVTGGRVAAREILLNTPAVSTLVLEGKMFQLPVALDSGRRHGMVPLTDSLSSFVREGTVNAGEAYRKALDRAALIAALKRDGVDTSFAERLA
jgi:twitching motility protein PilT